MFERLQTFLASITGSEPSRAFEPDDPRVAVMALCIQVMEADGQISKSEQVKVRSMIKDYYALDDGDLEALMAAGQSAESEAIDFYRFTSDIKRHLNEEQRIELVGMLWQIVYADGERSEMEDHVIWRIADLLGVSGRDRIIKRQEVAARMEVTGEDASQEP
ncbi:tellurite resistance TerB family protein [Pararhizobium sp.]|uniref:tellurite resistance TerB family protein n=1 Tax=Pararhizobium sp. TaxID=1977563 RepID=UPI00271E270C|nr:TerB family tellurite resistance protein [Pararhizobium sp.]MDO9416540.1 TerB family tellurite resistance protein [Pararhizobium sp.]